jgi:AcrR family transcriptional regulator
MTVKRAKPGPRSQERQERLIAAGYRAMVRSGLAGARTRDIAAEAGITVATLHYYFPTKGDLVRSVLEHTIRERMLAPLRLDAEWPDGLAALRTMLTGLHRQAEVDPGHFRLLHEMVWTSHEDPVIHRLIADCHDEWHQTINGWLETGQREGRVRGDLDTVTVAGMIMFIVLGMVMRPPMPPGADTRLSEELDRLLASLD